jgi:hypothetical protein
MRNMLHTSRSSEVRPLILKAFGLAREVHVIKMDRRGEELFLDRSRGFLADLIWKLICLKLRSWPGAAFEVISSHLQGPFQNH